jgi:N6-L-threonylcarbamoyladenine synthase
LIGALLVGISYAKSLAFASGKPLVPVNHVFAHVHGALLGLPPTVKRSDLFPALSLVVSGGHTNLYFMEHECDFQLVAYSIDDACGESFDKVGKLLGLPYPGGPEIEKLARSGDVSRFIMPRMLSDRSKLLFSYSGLKTHMVNLRRGLKDQFNTEDLADLCAGFQEEALGQLVRKLEVAEKKYPQARSILIAGGVAANMRFRDLTKQHLSVPVYFPDLGYCSDNAAMIAALGYSRYDTKTLDSERAIYRSYNWDAFSRYNF